MGEQPVLCLSKLGQDLAAGRQNEVSKPSGFKVSILEHFSLPNELQAPADGDSPFDLRLLPEDN